MDEEWDFALETAHTLAMAKLRRLDGALLLFVEPSFEPKVAYDVGRDGRIVRTVWDEDADMKRLGPRPHRLLAKQLLPTLHRTESAVPQEVVDRWRAQLDAAPLPPRSTEQPRFAATDGTFLGLVWWRGAARVELEWRADESPPEWAPIVDQARAICAELDALPWPT